MIQNSVSEDWKYSENSFTLFLTLAERNEPA